MNSKFGRAGGAGRAMRGLKDTGPPPLGRGMGALQPRLQSLGSGPVGLRGAGMAKRASGGLAKGRLGGRDHPGGVARSSSSSSAVSQDEKFQLQQFEVDAVRPFAMAIRLTPELLSDLKRAEAEGAACLMKFGFSPAGNGIGNVLKIGDEEFRLNSIQEDGGLCDIFEEKRRGEDGNGILKEAGSVWRKLSVFRTLDASEKDRVKKRSVEAQQQQKSRKAIILDPTHSQNLTQNSSIAGDGGTMNSPGSSEAIGRRPPIKQKVQPPKKKCKPNSPVHSAVPAPTPVPVQKPLMSTASAIASAKAAKAASVASPELPPSGKLASLPPPLPNGKQVAEESAAPSLSSAQMDSTPSPATTTPDTVGAAKPGVVVGATELRNCLITLLTENPKGMTLKAVEKSLGESMLHVKPEKKTIEKAIRAIASYHAPGKYILKEGVTFAKPSSNSGSSPENAAADSPLADSPALPDMNVDSSSPDEITGGARHKESGLPGDKLGSLPFSGTVRVPSIVHKSNENAVSRAIRKASENYQKSQPHSHSDHVIPASAAHAQKFEGDVKKVDDEVETEQVSGDGDENGEVGIIQVGGCPDMNRYSTIENPNGGAESVPNSPKEKANSGATESSSSSGSSDSDSESSDSGDSRSGTSGSGSDSDSDGSSSDSDDENMDEDVEIVSDDEDRGNSHLKPKANDKKKTSHQSKEAKRAKLKPPEKHVTPESEEIDIGGDEGAGHLVIDSVEGPTVLVKNLDTDDLEVDVVSVGGGDSPGNTGSVSPLVSEKHVGERKREVANAPAAVDDIKELTQKSSGTGNSASLSKEDLSETGETGAQKDAFIRKRAETGKTKSGAAEGRANSMANNLVNVKNNSPKSRPRTGAKEAAVLSKNRPSAQSSSPVRPETSTQTLLGSPAALKKDVAEISPRPAKEISARRKFNGEMRNSVSMEAKTENEELVEKLVEAPTRPWPRPGKPELNRLAPQSQSVDATPESGARGVRDCEGPALAGRETDAEVLPSASRPTRDGPWRQNLDEPGLLGKPGGVGRSQGRETEANLSTSRQPKNLRRANNDLDAARRNEPVNDPDSWWKPTRDLDGTKVGTDNDVVVNRFRKEMTKSEGSKGTLTGSCERQTENKFRESPDRESGEWRESTPGLEQLDTKGKSRSSEAAPVSGLILNRSQTRDLRKPSPGKGAPAGDFSKRPSPVKAVADFRRPSPGIAAGGDLRKPSPVKTVGDLKNPSPAKGAGNIRKPSPVTSNAQKLGQAFHKELSRSDQAVARETNRAVSETSKVVPSSEVEERPEGGSLRNSRASNDTFERPMDFRGAKRQLDDGSGEPLRVVKKSSGASVAPASSFNRGVSERKQVSPSLAQKPQAPEADRGGPIEGPTSLAGPSGKASGIENGRKQRLSSTAQKSSAKDGMELPRGRDWKSKTVAGLLGPGGEKKRENPQSGPRVSNGKRHKSSSSPEAVSGKPYFAKYEKDAPVLRGPIRSLEEAETYKNEFQTKYHVYTRLYADLDRNGGHFHSFKREMLQATSHPDKLQQISTKVRREFYAIRKEFKRMQKTFDILHEELQTIKHHLRSFAGKAGQG